MSVQEPAWTVVSETANSSGWRGARWDFFGDKASAFALAGELEAEGCRPTVRQYNRSTDLVHVGIDQRLEIMASLQVNW